MFSWFYSAFIPFVLWYRNKLIGLYKYSTVITFSRFTFFDAHVQVWVLSCFPVVADPSTVEQWRVPFPLAKRVAKLVSPLSFTCQSRSNSLNAYFSDLCLEGQNLSLHFAFSRACSVIFLFTICKWQDDFEKLYIMLYDCFSSRDLVPLLIVY